MQPLAGPRGSASFPQAWQLAPQVGPVCLVLAQALMKNGRHAEAVAVLSPLSINAHGDVDDLVDRLMAAAQSKAPVDQIIFVAPARNEEKKD